MAAAAHCVGLARPMLGCCTHVCPREEAAERMDVVAVRDLFEEKKEDRVLMDAARKNKSITYSRWHSLEIAEGEAKLSIGILCQGALHT